MNLNSLLEIVEEANDYYVSHERDNFAETQGVQFDRGRYIHGWFMESVMRWRSVLPNDAHDTRIVYSWDYTIGLPQLHLVFDFARQKTLCGPASWRECRAWMKEHTA